MINIYGFGRFVFDSKPKIIDMDYNDQNGYRVLLKIKGIRGQWLSCLCSLTGKTCLMEIPDRINTCKKANRMVIRVLEGQADWKNLDA